MSHQDWHVGPLRKYSFGNAFAAAIQAIKMHWGLLTVAGLILVGVIVATTLPGVLIAMVGKLADDPDIEVAIELLGDIVSSVLALLVYAPLWFGATILGANAVVGRARIVDLMLGFKRYPQVLGATLLLILIYGATATACVVAGAVVGTVTWVFAGLFSDAAAAEAGIGVGFAATGVLLVATTILVSMRVHLAPAIAADPQLGPIGAIAALRHSWQMAHGLGWSMAALLLVSALAASASTLLLCAGYFVIGLPLLIAVNGAMYAMIARSGTPPMDGERARTISRITIRGAATAILVMMVVAVVVIAVASGAGNSSRQFAWQSSSEPIPSRDSITEPTSPAPRAAAPTPAAQTPAPAPAPRTPAPTPPPPAPAPRTPTPAAQPSTPVLGASYPFTTTYRTEQAGAHRRQWTLTLDPAFDYEFMASSEQERDIDLRILQRGRMLDEDLLTDHIPIVSVSGISGEATLELIFPSTTRRGDTVRIRGERTRRGAQSAPSGSGAVDPGRIIAQRTYRATQAGAHPVDFTYTLDARSGYTFSAVARREIDIDLFLYQGDLLLDSDALVDHFPMVSATGVRGEVRLRLRFPSSTRVGDEVDIVVRQQ